MARIPHSDHAFSMPVNQFRHKYRRDIVRSIPISDYTIHLVYIGTGSFWCVEQREVVHLYAAPVFMARINALADCAVPFAAQIRRAIATNLAQITQGPRSTKRGRKYVWHSPAAGQPQGAVA